MEFFNLESDKSAVVRILSTSVEKMERGKQHKIVSEGRNRIVKCLGDNCPLCASGNEPSERLYVHLWDYTDNKEKVWNRTPNEKFIGSLKGVEDDWGSLKDAVVRISREGQQFPKYEVKAINPRQYAEEGMSEVDKDCGYMCAPYRSADEMTKYIETGILPDHVKKQSAYIPREEWIAQQKAKEDPNQTAIPEVVENDADDELLDEPF